MNQSTSNSKLLILISLLLIKAVVITLFIKFSSIGLSPDEAQYWTWSQQLDWGYYSKPPGIAWQIYLGTLLFGNTVLGVRVASILIGVISPLLLYNLTLKCRLTESTAFWSAIILAFSPLGIISSILAITDVGMILFWISALLIITQSISEERHPNYYIVGCLIAFGALFKWPIYLFWVVILFAMPIFPNLRSKHILGGALVSLLGLLPGFTWNMQHEWATYRHVTASIQGTNPAPLLFAGNIFEFIGAQIALLSPILFVLLLFSVLKIVREKKIATNSIFFCCFTTVLLLGSMTILSIFKKVQGNWCDFAYPSAIVLIAWYGCNTNARVKKWMIGGIFLSIMLSSFIFLIPHLQENNLAKELKIPYKINPFKHTLGWEQLPSALKEKGYRPGKDFLFSSNYQMSSLLSFYSEKQQRAYFLNLFGVRNNQFSYWPSMREEQIGKDGYYVIVENAPHLKRHLDLKEDYIKKLSPYFEHVEFLGVSPLYFSYEKAVKEVLIFRGISYNGNEPERSTLY